ncbi:DUF881 domain-containing protein [Actinoplanes sp. NPDC051633]|uniref:DUF881 domain-containing protein n=1 Tax=Actinoplanes sp. NPDC051633 TaxID=3155670 RepID=UPI003433513D
MSDERDPESPPVDPAENLADDEANKPTVPIKRPVLPPADATTPPAGAAAGSGPAVDPPPADPPRPADLGSPADPPPAAGPPPVAEPPPAVAEPDDEATTLLSPVPRPDDGGATQRLVPPSLPEPHPEPQPESDDEETRLLVPPATADAGRDEAGSPDGVNARPPAGPAVVSDSALVPAGEAGPAGEGEPSAEPGPPKRKLSSAGALIGVLLALFGFTLVVQLRSNNTDQGLASARQEDLVRILSDLEAQDSRLQSEIAGLETSQRQLTSGVAGRQAAREAADQRAEELGLLAGTLRGTGPGLRISMRNVKASAVLNAVQELRGAGGEVMEIRGSGGPPVRIVASTYFVDAQDGISVDDIKLTGPFDLYVIGPAQTMETALRIPGGVVASVEGGGGSVTIDRREVVEVTAVRKPTTLQYARPAS